MRITFASTDSIHIKRGSQMETILNSLLVPAIIGAVGLLWKIGNELTKLRVVIQNLEEDIREIRKDIDEIEEDIDKFEGDK